MADTPLDGGFTTSSPGDPWVCPQVTRTKQTAQNGDRRANELRVVLHCLGDLVVDGAAAPATKESTDHVYQDHGPQVRIRKRIWRKIGRAHV